MALIICPECGKEISDKAASCPNCGYVLNGNAQNIVVEEKVKNRGSKKKDSTLSIFAALFALFTWTWWIGLILAIVDFIKGKNDGKRHTGSWFAVIFSIFYIFLLGITNDDNPQGAKNEPVVVQSERETAENETDESKPTENEIRVGGQFESDGLKVTIDSVNTDFTDYDDEYGYLKPDDGKKYIEVSFTYENKGDSDKYVSIYDCECYADGTLCEQSYDFGGDFINVNLSPSRNVSFKTYYVVPKDSKNIELEYKENIWTDDKVIIKVE